MYAALLSGFADNGDLDRHRQIDITRCVARQGLRGLYVGGSSGESGLMSTEELLEQQAIVHEATKGTSQRLIAHVGQPNLRDSVQLAKMPSAWATTDCLPCHHIPMPSHKVRSNTITRTWQRVRHCRSSSTKHPPGPVATPRSKNYRRC